MTTFFDIPHHTNRVWPGTPNNVMQTIEEAYQDGLITGTEWPENWKYVPGGPHYNFPGPNSKFLALETHRYNVYKAWIKGWHK